MPNHPLTDWPSILKWMIMSPSSIPRLDLTPIADIPPRKLPTADVRGNRGYWTAEICAVVELGDWQHKYPHETLGLAKAKGERMFTRMDADWGYTVAFCLLFLPAVQAYTRIHNISGRFTTWTEDVDHFAYHFGIKSHPLYVEARKRKREGRKAQKALGRRRAFRPPHPQTT